MLVLSRAILSRSSPHGVGILPIITRPEGPHHAHLHYCRKRTKAPSRLHRASDQHVLRKRLVATQRGSVMKARHRVVFVDIDGVLHSYPPHSCLQRMCWVPHIAALVLPHSDVRVVIHSSWRYDYSVELLQALLGELGSRLLGVTPLGPRFESIVAFVSRSDAISDYRIVDDMPDEFPRDPAPPELILCDGRTGVSAPRVRTALRKWLAATLPAAGGCESPGNRP